MALEPIPRPEYIPPINYFFLSPAKTIAYKCLSYPLCRIYWDNDKATAWTTESAWYDTGDPKKGWRRNGPNYPSFLVSYVDDCTGTIEKPRYITLRHKPIWAETLTELLPIINEARTRCRLNPIRPEMITLSDKVKERMIACS